MNNNIPLDTWINPKVEIKKSLLEGTGMFAREEIEEGEKVVIWGGKWGKDYVDKKGAEKAKKEGYLIMQWDNNLYSAEIRGESEEYFINHSCDPNIWMVNAFTLVARRDIKSGEEITADYALWESDEDWIAGWECNCGTPICRRKITGRDWRLPDVQKRYKNHFSPFLNKRMSS